MDAVERYLRACPKVELHVHLEGAIRPERVVAIAARHGEPSQWRHPEDVAHLFRHAHFDDFLAHFRTIVLAWRDAQDVHDVARDLFRELVAQHVVYAEVIFSAPVFARQGMPWAELLAAANDAAAAAEAEAASASRFNLVIDLVRNLGADAACRSVEELTRLAHPRVVGIHLGGDERAFPARHFAAAFARAREAGLGCAAHAGEADGAGSVRDAIDVLGATRIGHGIRCLEDAQLVRDLVARGITLEVCPTSNLRTGVVADWAAHPLPRLVESGIAVTLGADDPSYFATDLAGELIAAHRFCGLAVEELDRCADRGLAAAFLPATERRWRTEALATARAAVRERLTSLERR